MAADVQARLAERRTFALWLGSNPNGPDALERILTGEGTFGDAFERQRHSGAYSEVIWLPDGSHRVGWDPISNPRGGWGVYRRMFDLVGASDAVAMANFVPWGSATFDALLRGLTTKDAALCERVIAFAEELNRTILDALRPQVLIVPSSLGANRLLASLRCTHVSIAAHAGLERNSVQAGAKRLHVTVVPEPRGVATGAIVFVPHPSALRLSREAAQQFIDGLAQQLHRVTGARPSS
jgi:hypothetical protein